MNFGRIKKRGRLKSSERKASDQPFPVYGTGGPAIKITNLRRQMDSHPEDLSSKEQLCSVGWKGEKSPQKLSEDVIASASTALRRLHFRGASRKAKLQSSLESTNTSTDSSNTVITMVTVDTDAEDDIPTPPTGLSLPRRASSVCEEGKVPPKRLKILKRYARTNLEEERTPHGRGSSGFAAVQMTIDSDFGESIDQRSSPPLPDSPTIKTKKEITAILIQQPSVQAPSPEKEPEEPLDPLILKREENMRLLDVATTLTVDQLQEFDMKYGSPHHSRSQSVRVSKTARQFEYGSPHHSRSQSVRPRARPNFLSLPQTRTRVASMPNTGVEETFYRLRHFSITGKCIVNKGDSLRTRRPKSKESLGGNSSPPSSGPRTQPNSRQSSLLSCSSLEGNSYKVIMLGSSAVGKTSLISQFMTSEYLHSYDNSIDDEFGDKSVSVLLDGEESELMFVDHSTQQMSPTTCLENYKNGQAYCVVYSTSDRNSFRVAETLLQNLWKRDIIRSRAVILVANKTDLVRSRVVTSVEGKNLATDYDSKYIETSVGFNHNVDELLVGLVTQIRLKKEKKPEETLSPPPPLPCLSRRFPKARNARTSASLKVKGLLSKVWARDSKSKSCENLHVL